MKRAEITRRKALAEKLAYMQCKMAGLDPDQKEMVAQVRGRAIYKAMWVLQVPNARMLLATMGWPDVQPGKEEDAQEKD